MGCNCCCSTDKEKDKKPEEKPVDPKVEEAKELKRSYSRSCWKPVHTNKNNLTQDLFRHAAESI